ncbi:MAG: beta-lactamase family protein [Bacteroidetes bacterium]|nr:beta-lactamase family protein [Bacteroidota bacterium]
MRHPLIILSAALLLVSTASAQHIARIDGSHITADSLDCRITRLMSRANVAGLCIAVFNKNTPVYHKAFGYANAQTKAPLTTGSVLYGASFSKVVFTYIAMKVIESGAMDLDSPLVSYLDKPLYEYQLPGGKGYADLRTDQRYQKITARMCLDHTSGLPNYRSDYPDGRLRILFEPGSRYSYSGEGMCLLQFVIEQATGKSLEELCEQKVFHPMHMTHSSFMLREHMLPHLAYGHDGSGHPYPLRMDSDIDCSASMRTTLDDYSHFFGYLMQEKGLKKSGYKEMFTPQLRLRSRQQFGPNSNIEVADNDKIELSYGLGVVLMQTPYGPAFFKEGRVSGFQHYCIAYPDKDIGVIIMTDSDNGESIFKALLEASIADTFTPWYWENYIPKE